MSAPSLAPVAGAILVGTLATGLLAVAPTNAAEPAQRRNTNPLGTAAGSRANGTGNLKVSLALTADGKVKVSWKRPAPASQLRRFEVKVGPNRLLDNLVKTYKVGRTAQSLVVKPAFGVLPDSGNFSFVKVVVHRRTGQTGASPTKWIGAPIRSTCTALPEDTVTVAAFNIRNWQAEERSGNKTYPWEVRGPNVVNQIISSGVGAVAIQEASGFENVGYGPMEQDDWLLGQLNQRDPRAGWADALSDDAYKNPGKSGGLKGTRVFYKKSEFNLLDAGLKRLNVPGLKSDSLMPWAVLQSVTGTQAPFVLTSNHLDQGEDQQSFEFRAKQVEQMIPFIKQLHATYASQVIVAGDLNSTANTNPYNQVQLALLQAGLFDAYATTNLTNGEFSTTNGLDFPVRPTPHRRDYILTYGTVRGSCAYTNVAYRTPDQVASDHFMQIATLPLPY